MVDEQVTTEDTALENTPIPDAAQQSQPDLLSLIKQPGFYDLSYLGGLIETVTTVPTHVPSRFEQQVKMYVDSLTAPTVKRLYVYSNKVNAWYGFDIIPSQTGYSGRYLKTDGSSLSWGNVNTSNNFVDAGNQSSSVTFDLSISSKHVVTLTGSPVTLSLSNVADGQVFLIRLKQDGTGSRLVTWFSTIKWPGGVTPTLTTTASKADVFGFVQTSSGNYDGFILGQNL